MRKKSFSFINITGLSIGMAAAILILLWIQNEVSYDKFHDRKDRLFEVWNRYTTDGKIGWLCDNSRPDHLHRSKQRQEWREDHRQNAGASQGLLLQGDGCECRRHLAFGYDPFESQVI